MKLIPLCTVFLTFLGALSASTGATAGAADDSARRPLHQPNVLVVVADDLHWRDIDDSIPTPSLDALRAQGLTYRRFYAQPFCSPTRYALLLGRQPFRDLLGDYIRVSDTTEVNTPVQRLALPMALRTRGYRTLLAGKWHLNTTVVGEIKEAPRLFGFESCRAGTRGNIGASYHDWTRIDDGVETATTEYSTSAITNAAIDWWRDTPGSKFAWVAYHASHGPLHPAPQRLLPAGYQVGPTNRDYFESMTVALDTELGRLFAAVDLRDTLVVFVSDNGTPWAGIAPDQELDKVKGSVFEGGINVPFIVAGWGVEARGDCDALVSCTDLFATVGDLAGYHPPLGIAEDSVSFLDTFSDPERRPREWVYATRFKPNGPGPYISTKRAVVTERYKLMARGASSEFLYDLVADPREESPLDLGVAANLAIYEPLKARLEAMKLLGSP